MGWQRTVTGAWRAGVLALAMLCIAMPVRAAAPDLAALGQRLYRDGIGVSGRPIAITDHSGQPLMGPQANCVSCHRASGYGSNEGSVYVPPITGPILFSRKTPERVRLLPGMFQQVQPPAFTTQLNSAEVRPAYDAASLAKILRQGIDVSGKPIAAVMPRYKLSDRDVAALVAWLATLAAHPDPGIDDTTIRFAVIVSDRTPEAQRKAVIDTANAYALQVNRGTVGERSRPNFSPYHRSEFAAFWRTWAIDVWELKGAEAGWPQQLADHYAAAPVFAVASSAVPGAWQPIGQFCDAQRLPCLFPLTDMPAPATATPGYTLYLSGGLPLEARAMAAYLGADGKRPAVVQVADAGLRGTMPAAALAAALPPGQAQTIAVAGAADWDAAIRRGAAAAGPDGVLAVWPGDDVGPALAALQMAQPAVARVMLASAAEPAARAMAAAGLADDMMARIRIMHPTELPTGYQPLSFRIRQWLNARRVALTPPEAQYNVYYSLSVLEKAMMEIQGDFSRDYLIEHIETIAESNLSPGVYPSLSLGPGQRIASNGSYVVRLDKAAVGGISADGPWIVP